MGLFGGLATMIGGAAGIYGGKLKVPEIGAVDPEAEQRKAIAGNLAVLPQAQQLAAGVNTFNAAQLRSLIEQILPGFGAGMAKGMGTAGDLMSGQVPSDVARRVRDVANAGAVAGGYGGSGLQHNLTLRDLGLTSLQAQQMGLQQFGQLFGMAQGVTPSLYDFSTAFLSPAQRIQVAQRQQALQFQRDLMEAQAEAAPDPNAIAMAQGAGETFDSLTKVGMGLWGAGVFDSGATTQKAKDTRSQFLGYLGDFGF